MVSQSAMSMTVNSHGKDFTILKSDELYIGGYASIEVVDKQNDLITLEALNEAVKKYMTDPKYRNVMTNHSNVQVGEVVKDYRDTSGKLWKTDVDDVGFFVVIKLRDDIEKAKEVGREIRKGTMRSFSIGGQALEKRKRNNDELGDYNEISKLELHEVTICEKGINPEAKFDILKQDVNKMTNINEAIGELNTLLKNLESNELDNELELPLEGETMPEEELLEEGTEELGLEELPADELLSEDEGELLEDDLEGTYKRETLTTGNVTAGDIGNEYDAGGKRNFDDGQDSDTTFQDKSGSLDLGSGKLRVAKKVWGNSTPTLDLTQENLEKAYAEFKAEQMEKMAYDDIKRGFQTRFNTEVVVKQDAIEKASYDPRTEVNELKKQFSDLLDTLKNDAEMTIKKQENAVASLNIPTYDEIAKMDWSDIHLTIQRLEENYS